MEELELLLVGAGNVAFEKLTSLLSNAPAARITVVAPSINEQVVHLLKQHPFCEFIQRPFVETDLDKKDLVILATDDKELHKRIKLLADNKGILVNVADTPELCDFYLGSIVNKGNLKIAISTNGKSPTMAKRVKEVLNELLPDEIDELILNLNRVRSKLNGDFAEKVKQLNEITKTLTETN